MSSFQFRKFKDAERILGEIFEHRQSVICVHYSCESFYDRPCGTSPRVTSIAVRLLGTGQTRSFSIHQQAELSRLKLEDIPNQYDCLENRMLTQFYEFVAQHHTHKWMHWNMRDGNYGFEALAHRFRVLGGAPVDIQDAQKIDLARIMRDFLGPEYVPHPRLAKLLELNNMTPQNFMSGAQEAEAFTSREYVRLHQSTLSKVDAIANIVEEAVADRLACDNSYFARRGLTFSSTAEILKNHPIYGFLAILATVIAIYGFFYG